ncbi:GNAT family N-acetyltransferase [Spirosoma montaniterrae]|uniref:GNAT family N-acetyltransferase n=1 Tax=Spirosoma montaniterrae TaxID=1178516 RepID=UPI00097DF949|nr:GNAT family N-acetyltransferase [Spirosoma montaniterrae]
MEPDGTSTFDIQHSVFNIKDLFFFPRSRIDTLAWDACVMASAQRLIYGYSWYLDAVTSARGWKWVGLVLPDEQGNYRAVMPVPLRRRWGKWVVYQPLFCQMLTVFSRDATLDPTPFFDVMLRRFRYGAKINLRQYPAPDLGFQVVRQHATHVLNLSATYETIYKRYSRDRRTNLRRGIAANWRLTDSVDAGPLLRLFRENHADTIPGGVGEWAYTTLQNLISELESRNLGRLRYAERNGQIEAGALFVQEGNRIIYLFNAASEAGRRGNARTVLLDEMIREKASGPVLFDFESPDKSSVVAFYQSFGAAEEPFWTARWSRLTWLERGLVWLLKNTAAAVSGHYSGAGPSPLNQPRDQLQP